MVENNWYNRSFNELTCLFCCFKEYWSCLFSCCIKITANSDSALGGVLAKEEGGGGGGGRW